jgi:hypothetical protein
MFKPESRNKTLDTGLRPYDAPFNVVFMENKFAHQRAF